MGISERCNIEFEIPITICNEVLTELLVFSEVEENWRPGDTGVIYIDLAKLREFELLDGKRKETIGNE